MQGRHREHKRPRRYSWRDPDEVQKLEESVRRGELEDFFSSLTTGELLRVEFALQKEMGERDA